MRQLFKLEAGRSMEAAVFAWEPRGNYLATSGEPGLVHVYQLHPLSLVVQLHLGVCLGVGLSLGHCGRRCLLAVAIASVVIASAVAAAAAQGHAECARR